MQRLDRRRPRGPVNGVRTAHGGSGGPTARSGSIPRSAIAADASSRTTAPRVARYDALSLHDRGTDTADRSEQYDDERRNDATEASSSSLVRCDPLLEVTTFGHGPIEGRIEE